MAVDSMSEADRRFLKDNLLMNEDWDSDLAKMDDLSSLHGLLDIESSMMADELMQQLPDDLELAMPQQQGLAPSLDDPFKDFSDSSDSGVDMYSQTKSEPLSPASSHCSESSAECLQTNVPIDMTMSAIENEVGFLSTTFSLDTDLCLPMDLSEYNIKLEPDLNNTLVSEEYDINMDTFSVDTIATAPSIVTTRPHRALPSRVTVLPDGTVLKIETPDTPPHTPPRDNVISTHGTTSVIRTIPASSSGSVLKPGTRIITTSSGMKIVLQAPPPGKGGTKTVCSLPAVTSEQGVVVNSGTAAVPSVAVTQMLQNKVKIQPKPTSSPETAMDSTSVLLPPKKSASSPMSQGKALVLTPEEFAKLTAQGILKFQQPSSSSTTSPSAGVASYPTSSVPMSPVKSSITSQVSRATTPAFSVCGLPNVDTDVKVMKRQQRMMKNRESACLSRKKKKVPTATLR